jgi:hypothetical protein
MSEEQNATEVNLDSNLFEFKREVGFSYLTFYGDVWSIETKEEKMEWEKQRSLLGFIKMKPKNLSIPYKEISRIEKKVSISILYAICVLGFLCGITIAGWWLLIIALLFAWLAYGHKVVAFKKNGSTMLLFAVGGASGFIKSKNESANTNPDDFLTKVNVKLQQS